MPNIYLLILLEALAIYLLTHLLVPINIRFSRKLKIVALPSERRIHKGNIPEA